MRNSNHEEQKQIKGGYGISEFCVRVKKNKVIFTNNVKNI